jgi:sulfotransferase
MNKQYSFLSGLPRTGSTLLSSIISQNPKIHAEGISNISELLWSVFAASVNEKYDSWNENILVGQKQESIRRVIRAIPDAYYQDVSKPFILDKNRSWIFPQNLFTIKTFITNNPKVVVLIRPLEEVAASFIHLQRKNGWQEENIFRDIVDDDGPVISHVPGISLARQYNQGEYLFVEYDDLVFETKKTLNLIYDFCEWPRYEHQLENIKRPFVQNDQYHNMNGLHDVRKNIEKQKYNIDLPEYILEKCRKLNPLVMGEII